MAEIETKPLPLNVYQKSIMTIVMTGLWLGLLLSDRPGLGGVLVSLFSTLGLAGFVYYLWRSNYVKKGL